MTTTPEPGQRPLTNEEQKLLAGALRAGSRLVAEGGR